MAGINSSAPGMAAPASGPNTCDIQASRSRIKDPTGTAAVVAVRGFLYQQPHYRERLGKLEGSSRGMRDDNVVKLIRKHSCNRVQNPGSQLLAQLWVADGLYQLM